MPSSLLYGVTTARLNQQVRRNRERFPADFLFELTTAEFSALMLQNASSKPGRGKLPFAFTEHGAIMAAPVLNSPRATEMTVYVVRAFVKLGKLLTSKARRARELARHPGSEDSAPVQRRLRGHLRRSGTIHP